MFCPFCKASSSNLNDESFDKIARRLIVVKYREISQQEYSHFSIPNRICKVIGKISGTPSKSIAQVKYQLFFIGSE